MIAEAPESPGGLGGERYQTGPERVNAPLPGGAILHGNSLAYTFGGSSQVSQVRSVTVPCCSKLFHV